MKVICSVLLFLFILSARVYCSCILKLETRELEIHEPAIQNFHDLDSCKNILSCTFVDKSIKNAERLQARALPNQRLARAFGINNSFTTMDSNYHSLFRANAFAILSQLTDEKWIRVARDSWKLVRRRTVDEKHNTKFWLVPFVQSFSLKISLFILFDIDPLGLDDEVALSLASGINELWVASKVAEPDTEHSQYLQQRVRRALIRIFPGHSLAERDTPMNLILPAYETLWRVVLRLFLEVTFRNPEKAFSWRKPLSLFLANPNCSQFEKATGSKDAIAVSHLVDEALRLYPPTRRVYRTFSLPPNSETRKETVTADIERCQRDPGIWGLSSLEFEPKRWIEANEDQRKSSMPFGGGRFQCPAKKSGFGPRIIGLLVAAMTDSITADEWELESDENEQVISDKPLDSDRLAYETLSLSRISSQLHNN